jgi:hypothetical protein
MLKRGFIILVVLMMLVAVGVTASAATLIWELNFENDADLSWLTVCDTSGKPFAEKDLVQMAISDEVGGYEGSKALKLTRRTTDIDPYVRIGMNRFEFPFPTNTGYFEVAFYDPYPLVPMSQYFLATGRNAWLDLRLYYNAGNPGMNYYYFGYYDGSTWDNFYTVKKYPGRADDIEFKRSNGWHTVGIEVKPTERNYYIDRKLVNTFKFPKGDQDLQYITFWLPPMPQSKLDDVKAAGFDYTLDVYWDSIKVYTEFPGEN